MLQGTGRNEKEREEWEYLPFEGWANTHGTRFSYRLDW